MSILLINDRNLLIAGKRKAGKGKGPSPVVAPERKGGVATVASLVQIAAIGQTPRSVVNLTGGEVARIIKPYYPNPDRSFVQRLKVKIQKYVLGTSETNVAEFESYLKSCEDAGDKVEATWMNKTEYRVLIAEQQEKTHNAEQEKLRKAFVQQQKKTKKSKKKFAKKPFDDKDVVYPQDYDDADDATQFLRSWKVVYVY